MQSAGCLILWAVAEAVFFVILKVLSRRWQRPLDRVLGDVPEAALTPAEILRMIEDYMSRSLENAESFLATWFFDTPASELPREDVEDLFCWSVYVRRRHEITEEELDVLKESLDRIQEKVGLKFNPDGRAKGHPASTQKFAAHVWETNCTYHHLPLVYYMIAWFAKRVIGTPVLLLMGFRYRKEGGLPYWIRERDCSCGRRRFSGQQEALLFFHGISFGLITYAQFLLRFRHQTVILVELNWVTFNPLCSRVPGVSEFCSDVSNILSKNKLSKVCLSAHSYGSFMVAWLLRNPEFTAHITRVILISSPALNLFIAKTCKIVCYDKPFWFDYTLARLFFRHFFWHQCVLTASSLPKGSTVVLVENDELVPVQDCVRDCCENHVRCHVIPRTTHGGEMIWPLACNSMVQFIRSGQEDTAPRSRLFQRCNDAVVQVMDLIGRFFIMRGHSPFNLQVLTYLDDFWPGGQRSWSNCNLVDMAKSDAHKDSTSTAATRSDVSPKVGQDCTAVGSKLPRRRDRQRRSDG